METQTKKKQVRHYKIENRLHGKLFDKKCIQAELRGDYSHLDKNLKVSLSKGK